jgi:hypothetical protein
MGAGDRLRDVKASVALDAGRTTLHMRLLAQGGMTMADRPTTFERLLRSLEPLTSREVVDVVRASAPKREADALAAQVDRLSTDSLRVLAARVLLRLGPVRRLTPPDPPRATPRS